MAELGPAYDDAATPASTKTPLPMVHPTPKAVKANKNEEKKVSPWRHEDVNGKRF